jgi:hypothetical protein
MAVSPISGMHESAFVRQCSFLLGAGNGAAVRGVVLPGVRKVRCSAL